MRSLILSAALVLAGCAVWPPLGVSARDHLEYLARAANASPEARAVLWRETVANGSTQEIRLRHALLQTIPGAARYDAASAERELVALLADRPSGEVAAVARMRLEFLHSYGECRTEADILKKRLSKIADIERGNE